MVTSFHNELLVVMKGSSNEEMCALFPNCGRMPTEVFEEANYLMAKTFHNELLVVMEDSSDEEMCVFFPNYGRMPTEIKFLRMQTIYW